MKQETGNEAVDKKETAAEQAETVETVTAEAESAPQGQENQYEAEIEQLKQTAEDNYQKYLRAQADFDNFRRRSRQEKEEFAKYASLKVIEGLLPIVDNFERAVNANSAQKDYDSLHKGVEMILRQLLQLLEQEGVTPIEAAGKPFNPEFHQAVMQVSAEEGVESGTVVEELQKGYMMKERVIRPSMVKVSE
ncbi:nucleotide exchange factor GrpE [Paenibacillus thermotolerans]|uniref:nucleotide exchange factor GrpE n=1 Tax=Paenibacillus thermotolerans TaxID=3027807 RepID=UPI00236774E9|nr:MULTISPECIES: nucleotide exchange factor GrpE [unclassified Paenibacillus]